MMTEPRPKSEAVEMFRFLYPIFKQEVYKRRAEMARIARQGSLLFLSLSIVSVLLSGRFIHPGLKGLASAGVFLVALLLIFQIRQEKSRHERAKRQLITLEKELGLFEVGSYLPDAPLYPPDWQERPMIDRGLWLAAAGLIGTSLLLIWVILLA